MHYCGQVEVTILLHAIMDETFTLDVFPGDGNL